MSFSLDEYIDVAERVVHFRELYPEGTLQRVEWEIREVGNQRFVVYTAAAYRTPDDPRPGMGTAWEPFPGTTPYTRNSELMNAETAAWGRAIVALGLTSNRKLASRQEVKARRDEQAQPPKSKPKPPPASDIPGDATDLRGPSEVPAPPPAEDRTAQANAEDFRRSLAVEMKRQGVSDTVGTFRDYLAGVGIEAKDVASREKRWEFIKALSASDAGKLEQALLKSGRPTLEDAIDAGDVDTEDPDSPGGQFDADEARAEAA